MCQRWFTAWPWERTVRKDKEAGGRELRGLYLLPKISLVWFRVQVKPKLGRFTLSFKYKCFQCCHSFHSGNIGWKRDTTKFHLYEVGIKKRRTIYDRTDWRRRSALIPLLNKTRRNLVIRTAVHLLLNKKSATLNRSNNDRTIKSSFWDNLVRKVTHKTINCGKKKLKKKNRRQYVYLLRWNNCFSE